MADLLLVEDEADLALSVEIALCGEGHVVRVASTAAAAREALAARRPDLVVLDLGLPDGDGLSICAELRQAGNLVPVVILSARNTLKSRLDGLALGADDYVTKPFELPELLARVAAHLRRSGWHGAPATVRIGRLEIDFERGEATRDGVPVPLTDLELRMLDHLRGRRGAVVKREELLQAVWGVSPQTRTRTVDMFASRLRQLLEPDPVKPRHLVSVRGLGYRLVLDGSVDEG